MEKDLFLKLYKQGVFNFDYFNNCEVCNRELCKFYNDIHLIKIKNFNKIDALFDLVNISIMINKLYNEVLMHKDNINHLNNLITSLIKKNYK